MNDELEAFRKRLRGSEKRKLDWPFWIGSPTAWLALIVSSATAFSTLIYHSDELSVVANPIIWSSIPQIGIQVPRNVTYINSGSRPVAVLAVHLVAAQQKVKTDPIDCSHGQFDEIEIATDQAVVTKPYDIVTKKLAIDGTEQEVRLLKLTDLNRKEWISSPPDPTVAICLVVEIATSDSDGGLKIIQVTYDGHLTPHYIIKRNTFWPFWSFVGNDDRWSPLADFISIHEDVHFPKPIGR